MATLTAVVGWHFVFSGTPPGACQFMEHASMKSYSPQLPIPFDTDWHHQFGRRLSVFPRNIGFREGAKALDYWPDLATFTEDRETAQLAYYPATLSAFSVCVIYRKLQESWETVKFCDDLVLQYCAGETFEEVMEQTIAVDFCRGES
jgi:hypothetical protein